MAHKPVVKMSLENRAKQFMPFSALKGFDEALAAKEHVLVPRSILSEEAAKDLNQKMQILLPGMMITVIYYQKDQYIQNTGLISKIDKSGHILQIVNTRIRFEDIQQIILPEYCE